MKRSILFLLAMACLSVSSPSLAGERNAAAGLEKLKSLSGVWHAKDEDGRPVTVTYAVVSGGSAVMETIQHDQDADMVTIYHLDGERLMMTHYCALGNQPRMKAAAIPDGEVKDIRFSFVSGTNMKKNDPHMHGLTISFLDADHANATWSLYEKGRMKFAVVFEMVRKS